MTKYEKNDKKERMEGRKVKTEKKESQYYFRQQLWEGAE